jgi:hypothetical protein
VLNRIKVWVFVLVVVVVALLGVRVRTRSATARAVALADARLAAATAQLDAGLKLIQSRAASVAALAALDARLISALASRPAPPLPPKGVKGKAKKAPPPPEEDALEEAVLEKAVEAAARAAVDGAEKSLGFELPAGSFYAAADKGGIAKKAAAGASGPQGEAVAFMADAARGQPRRGFARVNEGLWYGVGLPMANGGALVLFVPLDEGWAITLKANAVADVTLSVGLQKPVSTLPPAEATPIVSAALARGGAPAGAGAVGWIRSPSSSARPPPHAPRP